MVRIQQFLTEEKIGCEDKLKIYKLILEFHYGKRIKAELIYNRYSLEFDFERDEVVINDDIMEEDEPIKTDVKTFFKMLQVSS